MKILRFDFTASNIENRMIWIRDYFLIGFAMINRIISLVLVCSLSAPSLYANTNSTHNEQTECYSVYTYIAGLFTGVALSFGAYRYFNRKVENPQPKDMESPKSDSKPPKNPSNERNSFIPLGGGCSPVVTSLRTNSFVYSLDDDETLRESLTLLQISRTQKTKKTSAKPQQKQQKNSKKPSEAVQGLMKVKNCFISKSVPNHNLHTQEASSTLNNVLPVHIQGNGILEQIVIHTNSQNMIDTVKGQRCIITDLGNRYEIEVISQNGETTVLYQYFLHNEKGRLIRGNVRKVIIEWKQV